MAKNFQFVENNSTNQFIINLLFIKNKTLLNIIISQFLIKIINKNCYYNGRKSDNSTILLQNITFTFLQHKVL